MLDTRPDPSFETLNRAYGEVFRPGALSIILPLRHPAYVAKAAVSVDALSCRRLLLGVASGDRPEEVPAMGMSFHDRGERSRGSIDYMRAVGGANTTADTAQGRLLAELTEEGQVIVIETETPPEDLPASVATLQYDGGLGLVS